MSSPSDNSRLCPACGAVYGADTEFCPKDGSKLEQSEQIIAGRFVLKARIGLGNMGTVHRAVQLPMGRQVAVKLLHTELLRNPEMVARFEREALAASTVDHPNAITIYDSGRTEAGQVYIAMEYLEGESLAAMLLRERTVPPMRALELWVPVVKAMVVAHRKGIIHRDLKPDNVFISRKITDEGVSEEIIKVLDFGIAKLLQAATGPTVGRVNTKTLAGTRLGTALYMAPEQLEGREAGKHSDVYALGLILIELMTGRLPWGRSAEEADTVMTMMRLVTPPKRLAELLPGQPFSPEFQQFFDDVLAVDPTKRPQDAGELLKRIARLPESQFMARPSERRSDVSQMLSAAFVSSVMRNPLENSGDTSSEGAGQGGDARTPVAALRPSRPPAPPTQPLVSAALPPASPVTEPMMQRPKPLTHLETLKRDVPAELLSSVAAKNLNPGNSADELPSLATAITPAARQSGIVASEDAGATVEFRRPTEDEVNGRANATLPQPVKAPRIDTAPPTQPLLLARLPADKVRSVGRGDSQTIEMRGRSADTMRSPYGSASRLLFMGLAFVAALLLLGLGYALLHLGKGPPPTRPLRVIVPTVNAPPPEVKAPPPEVALPPPMPELKPPPKVVTTEPEPTGEHPIADEPPAEKPRAKDHKDDKESAADESLQVTFRMRKPTRATLICGSEIVRSCDGNCTITLPAGTQCLVRRPGFTSKRFKYDELERKGRHGKVKLDVNLPAG